MVYFMAGDEGTRISHTAEYITDVLEPVSSHSFLLDEQSLIS